MKCFRIINWHDFYLQRQQLFIDSYNNDNCDFLLQQLRLDCCLCLLFALLIGALIRIDWRNLCTTVWCTANLQLVHSRTSIGAHPPFDLGHYRHHTWCTPAHRPARLRSLIWGALPALRFGAQLHYCLVHFYTSTGVFATGALLNFSWCTSALQPVRLRASNWCTTIALTQGVQLLLISLCSSCTASVH